MKKGLQIVYSDFRRRRPDLVNEWLSWRPKPEIDSDAHRVVQEAKKTKADISGIFLNTILCSSMRLHVLIMYSKLPWSQAVHEDIHMIKSRKINAVHTMQSKNGRAAWSDL